MRFVCDSCQAQYMISDDKLGAKGAKVRCKRCGHVILVRRPDVVPLPEPVRSEGAPAAGNPGAEAHDGKDGKKHVSAAEILSGVEDEEIGAVFDQALTESPDSPNLSNGSAFPDRAPGNEAPVPGQLPAPAAAPLPTYEWFVAIQDKQVGPIIQERLKQLWDSGEIGPDSLCWRLGLADWRPLSEMTELSSLLAPRPAKPVIIAPAPATSLGAPVESVFAATPRAERNEVPAASAAAPLPESDGWRPSAANALASLLQEEMKALNRPAPVAAPAVEAPQSSRPAAQTSPLMQPTAFDAPIGVGSAPRFGSYTEPRSHKGVIIGGLVGGLMVAAAVGVTFYFVRLPPPPAPVVAAAPQKAPTPEPAKPSTAAAVVNPPAASTPSAAPGAKPPDQKTETTAAAKTESPPATASAEPERSSGSRRDRVRHRSRSSSSSEQAGQSERSERQTVARAVEPPKEASDDEFQKEFGGGGERAPASRSERRSVYVPPAPGSASSDLPDTLGQSDIMSVVVQNKSSILGCVGEQKKRDPSLSGRMVMRWQIHTNGRTSNVSCQSDEFKGTPLASCLAGLIKSWTFPKHRIQGEPINFPFTF